MQEEAILNLKWDSFSSQLKNSLDACYENQYFVDLSLVCKSGTIIKCHKMILSNASSFFRRLLVQNEHPHPMIILHDIDADDLKTVVNFMYCGEIQVAKSEVSRVLKIAEILEVSGLKDIRGKVLIPEDKNSNNPSPATSASTEYPLRSCEAANPARNNMAVDASKPIGSSFGRKAPIARTNVFSKFEAANDVSGKCAEKHAKSLYNLRKKSLNIDHENIVGTHNQSTSEIKAGKSNVTNEKSLRKRTSTGEQISWSKVLSEICKEDRAPPLKRRCLMDEIEITACTSGTEDLSRAPDEPSENDAGSNCFATSKSPAQCEIFIKREMDISYDSECESDIGATARFECAENDKLTIDPPVGELKRSHLIGGAMTAIPKRSLFEISKRRGSSD